MHVCTVRCHGEFLVIWVLRVAVEVGHARRADGAAVVKRCRSMRQSIISVRRTRLFVYAQKLSI